MPTLADYIEEYLQDLLEEEDNMIELQRRMLADHFQCVPSQINYVLNTRFTPARGYIVETRRGGGGYIRIQKLGSPQAMQQVAVVEIGNNLSERDSFELLDLLKSRNLLSEREVNILKIVLQSSVKGVSEPGLVRANILKSLYSTFFRES